MGIYFIAAGTGSSKNRYKTLDRGWSVDEICRYTEPEVSDRLRAEFEGTNHVFLWGANKRSIHHLKAVRSGEYAVDVKNKEVVQVFRFCFWTRTPDTRLQRVLGWDTEQPKEKWRPFSWVFFLRDPLPTTRTRKAFFQDSFDEARNQNWLVGQRYFNDQEVRDALRRAACRTVEEFLGITSLPRRRVAASVVRSTPEPEILELPDERAAVTATAKPVAVETPAWLEPVVKQVRALRGDPDHTERDHEDLVASLLSALGYMRAAEIKFRRERIDMSVVVAEKGLVALEVKKDWALPPQSASAVKQAYDYALSVGMRYVIVTNGDRYSVYDRHAGHTYQENLVGEFRLTELTEPGLKCVEELRRSSLCVSGNPPGST